MAGYRDDDPEPGVADAWPDSGLARRDLLRSASAASVLLAAAGQSRPAGAAPPGGKFFSAPELALVDELSDMIIPTDEHSPGARAARVAAEIDRRLADGPDWDRAVVEERRFWREGLALVDKLARARFGTGFLAAQPAQRLELLTDMAAGERSPKKTEERFFVALKREAARAYYTSEIGVKQELEYKGNSYLQEFAGHDASTVPLGRKPP
jgi:gluconate 2-dehydrogenase gamma chain